VAEVVKAFRKQAAIDEIIKKRPPGGFAFATHVLDGQKSKGNIADYDYHRESVLFSRDVFLQLIYLLQKDANVQKLYVIAHSMGNQIVVDALAHAANNDVPTPLSEVVLAAPDDDKDVFLSWCRML
jgi:esterase/lipase superfamily enzyme